MMAIRCIHCDEFVDESDLAHWEVCEKHPARGRVTALAARVGELEAQVAQLREALQRAEALLKHYRWVYGLADGIVDKADMDAIAAALAATAPGEGGGRGHD